MRSDLSKKVLGFIASTMIMTVMFAVPVLASVTQSYDNVTISGIDGARCEVEVTIPGSITLTADAENQPEANRPDEDFSITITIPEENFRPFNNAICDYTLTGNNGFFKYMFHFNRSIEVNLPSGLPDGTYWLDKAGLALNPDFRVKVTNITGDFPPGVPRSFEYGLSNIDLSVTKSGSTVSFNDFYAEGAYSFRISQQSSSSISSSKSDDDDKEEEKHESKPQNKSSWSPAPAAAQTPAQVASTQLATAQTTLAALSVIPTASKEMFKTNGLSLNMTSVNTVDANTTKLLAANSDIPYNVTFYFMGKPTVCTIPAGFNYASYIKPDGSMNIHEVLWAVYRNQMQKQTRQRTTRTRSR